jgi:hypothetical protein
MCCPRVDRTELHDADRMHRRVIVHAGIVIGRRMFVDIPKATDGCWPCRVAPRLWGPRTKRAYPRTTQGTTKSGAGDGNRTHTGGASGGVIRGLCLLYSRRSPEAASGRLRKLADSGKRDPSIGGCPAAHTFDQQSIAGDSCIAEETHSRIFPVPVPTRSAARRN